MPAVPGELLLSERVDGLAAAPYRRAGLSDRGIFLRRAPYDASLKVAQYWHALQHADPGHA